MNPHAVFRNVKRKSPQSVHGETVCSNCLHDRLLEMTDDRIGAVLYCAHCGGIYPIRNGVPQLIDLRMILGLPDDVLAVWHVTQQRSAPLYSANHPGSCSIKSRADVRMVAREMNLRGKRVLDVGSGSFALPGYVVGTGYRSYVGIDPIPAGEVTDYSFRVAIGEAIPFANESFDVVIFGTSLDHVLDTTAVLRETSRVLTAQGEVYFWGGFVDDPKLAGNFVEGRFLLNYIDSQPTGFEDAVDAYLDLDVEYRRRIEFIESSSDSGQLGLVDDFHFRHFTRESLLNVFAEGGFQLNRERNIVTAEGIRSSLLSFIRGSQVLETVTATTVVESEASPCVEPAKADAVEGSAFGSVADGSTAPKASSTPTAEIAEPESKSSLPQPEADPAQASSSAEPAISALADPPSPQVMPLLPLNAVARVGRGNNGQATSELNKDIKAIRQQLAGVDKMLQSLLNATGLSPISGGRVSRALGRASRLLRGDLAQFEYIARALVRRAKRLVRLAIAAVMWLVRLPLVCWGLVRPRLCRLKAIAAFASSLGSQIVCLAMFSFQAAFFPGKRRPSAGGRRVLMLTISQIDVDPRINKVAKSLASGGYEVDVLCPSFDGKYVRCDAVAPGVRYIRIPVPPKSGKLWRMYQDSFRQVGMARAYDFVHANDLPTTWAGWILARIGSVPLIYDAHEMWSENVIWNGREYVGMSGIRRALWHALERFIVKRSQLFISVSPSICKEYQRIYKLDREPLLIANYPSLKLRGDGEATSIRELCNLDERHFVTLYLGGVNPARNIETVIRAHQHLPEHHVFVIRGPGIEYYRDEYNRIAEELGISHRIYYLSPVKCDDVLAGMKGADCGIVMLRNICKNFHWYYPNKFFEYMLGGLPVAVSDFPDVGAHIRREQCGVTFDPDSSESVAAAIRELATDRNQARIMGQRGKRGALERFNWEAAERLLLESYDELARGASCLSV